MDNLASSSSQSEKHVLRERMNARRKALTSEEAGSAALAAQRWLMTDKAWANARQVTLYVAARGEMSTSRLLEAAWDAGKQVLLPRCRPQQRGYMDFVLCASMKDLCSGYFGLLEPRPELPALPWEPVEPCDSSSSRVLSPDVLVIPGVAFDRQGNRLGYGGGYYDRALSHPALAGAARVGLAYSWQVVECVPAELWDCPVQVLCTEEGLQWL